MSTAVPLSSTPAAGQLVEHDGKTYDTVREGLAYILIPPNTRTSLEPKAGGAGKKKEKDGEKSTDSAGSKPQSVFYNPIQQFNRDLSVLAIKAFGEDWLRRRKGRNERSRDKKRQNGKKRSIDEFKEQEPDIEGEGGDKRVRSEERERIDEGGVKLDTIAQVQGKAGALEGSGELQGEETGTDNAQGKQQQKQGQPRFKILDALSATGLRALRYAKEIPFVTAVVANDMDHNAIKSMTTNIEHNSVGSKIVPNVGNAIGHMYNVAFPPNQPNGQHHTNSKYDVIDLDPYGTAAPFVDAALQALNDGGLLCVTCTDSGVFASTGYSEKTYALYGGMPVKGPHMHEVGLRLIINSVATSAARYGLAIEPLLSLSIDYYVRIFIRVRKSPADVKFLAGKTMLVYSCDVGCGAWTPQFLTRNQKQTGKTGNTWFKYTIGQGPTSDQLCEHCKSKMHVAGPMWGGPLHNQAFVEKILLDVQGADPSVYETVPRIEGMLSTALDELSMHESVTRYKPLKNSTDDSGEIIPAVPPELIDHHPFFVNPSALAKTVHCVAPSDAAMKGALRRAGYRATRSHCQPGSIKTDAPWTVIWEIMREWVRQKAPIKEGVLKTGSSGWHIMQAARPHDVDQANSEEVKEIEGESPEIVTESNGSTIPEMKPQNAKKMRVIFDEVLGKDAPGKRLVRYQQNPRENWGPMSRAK